LSVADALCGADLRDLALAPRLEDRLAWESLPEPHRAALVQTAEAALVQEWPELPAALYRRFCEDGNRLAFEDRYFARRRMLNALVLGEAVENRGRFLTAIEAGVALICGEAAWQLPAHNNETRGGAIQPEPIRHIVDLFAAETAAQLAVVHALLGDRLGAGIEAAVKERVLKPYLERDFWWTGRLGGRMNNWTVWCTQNILIAAFTLPIPRRDREEIAARAAFSLDAFLAEYGEHGACPEGAYYYKHAALCLFTALDVLNKITGGAISPLFRSGKLRNIAEFPLYAHISGDAYANFGDAAARMAGPGHRAAQFGAAVGSRALVAFAARHDTGDDPDDINLYDRLQGLFHVPETGGYRPAEGYLPDIGMFVARDDRFYVGANAGHNGADHNHNDVGNFIIYKGGEPVLIDVGVETYSAKTFSRDRYDIWTMQSSYHNLPDFGGVMQQAGTAFAARETEVVHGETAATIGMEISGAYPAQAGVARYHRRISLNRGKSVTIEDRFEADTAVTLNLMFAEEPRAAGDVIAVGAGAKIRLTGVATMSRDVIPVTDPRLAQSWTGPLYRLRITPVSDRVDMVIT
jgi:hypothetical protein